MTPTIQDAAVRAAVTVAARFGLAAEEPVVLADGANIVVHLRPAPVVAKVAASTPAVRRDNQDWLQRELDVSAFLAERAAYSFFGAVLCCCGSLAFYRADVLLKKLRASRLDNSHDTEMRKLLRADLLILDDFCLQPMDAADTADIYEIIVERHRTAATITTSNREPVEWLALMADGLLAQSAIDRLQSAAWELILDGDSYRHRQRPAISTPASPAR